jgi:hypothetical protein
MARDRSFILGILAKEYAFVTLSEWFVMKWFYNRSLQIEKANEKYAKTKAMRRRECGRVSADRAMKEHVFFVGARDPAVCARANGTLLTSK